MSDVILQAEIHFLTERVKVLEEKIVKSKRQVTTRAQQMLILKHSGLLNIILDYDITKKAKSIFLSKLLNADPDNIEEDLTTIRQDISGISTKSNYDFVIDIFKKSDLEVFRIESEQILEKLSKKE